MLLKLSDHPFMKHLELRRREEQAFADENPEVASAWREAIMENAERNQTALEKQLAFERRCDGLRMAGVGDRLFELATEAWGIYETIATKAVAELSLSRPVLLLCGSPGCGKTLASVRGLGDALEHSAVTSGLFVKSFELSRLSMFAPEDKARMASLSRTRFLILDDLGAEMLHDGMRPMLDELIDARYQNGSRTILTTNLDPQAFKARYGERIADRIREVGRVVLCGDKSLRRAQP